MDFIAHEKNFLTMNYFQTTVYVLLVLLYTFMKSLLCNGRKKVYLHCTQKTLILHQGHSNRYDKYDMSLTTFLCLVIMQCLLMCYKQTFKYSWGFQHFHKKRQKAFIN